MRSVQVVHRVDFGSGLPSEPHLGVESNVAAFILIPQITTPAPYSAARNSTLTIAVAPAVGRAQRAALLTENNTLPIPARDAAGPDETGTLDFPIPGDFPTGTQRFLRVQIDGAESPLTVNAAGEFSGPNLEVTP